MAWKGYGRLCSNGAAAPRESRCWRRPIFAMRRKSSAPCRMNTAACWSITAARLARLTSAAISSRSTAAVDSRSSQNAIGSSVSLTRLRAKARVDCARGPSLPSMLSGSPSTRPTACRSAASAQEARGIGLEGLARDGLDTGREPAVGIGGRDPDGLGSEIKPDQRAPRRQEGSGFGEGADDRGHRLSIACRRRAAAGYAMAQRRMPDLTRSTRCIPQTYRAGHDPRHET